MADKKEYEIQYLKGVGPKRAEVFAQAGITNYSDLILYFPTSYIDRNSVKSIQELSKIIKNENQFDFRNTKIQDIKFQTEYSLIGKIVKISEKEFGHHRKLLLLFISDGSGINARIVFFNRIEYFKKFYQIDDWIMVNGYPESDQYFEVSFTHPEIEKIDIEESDLYRKGGILPKYKLPEIFVKNQITHKTLRKLIKEVIETKKVELQETLPDYLLQDLKLSRIENCIEALHFPTNKNELEKARFRVKFEESFLFQLTLLTRRKHQIKYEKGLIIEKNTALVKTFYKHLPFELTQGQIQVLKDIFNDFKSQRPMNRLLQGDVGSGKTIVAIISMLAVIDAGYQVVFMAPTELLAEQHYNTLKKFLEPYSLKIELLVGGQKKKYRNEINEEISSGRTQIICGTHALFQSNIKFNKLAYVIIDEQHRFGVSQRAELIELAKQSHNELDVVPHILVMSATPIPRTLTMTIYGDLNVSVIKELPKNRKPIKTKVVFNQNRLKVYEFIKAEIAQGRQCYIVYPLVEKSEKIDYKAVTEHYEELKNSIFQGYRVGMLHGQLFSYEKDDAMQAFLNKELDILFATTVIEVGIDVPNATIMVIEDAERFGLSQLHQLRGRIGRGESQSYCFLFTKDYFQFQLKKTKIDPKERKAAIIRLKAMEETSDGFKISEIDLELRGPGDIMGTKQSGLPDFHYLDLVNDGEIISLSRTIASNIIATDPNLVSLENNVLLRTLKKYINKDKSFLGIA
jgi:ATP-dependent DNA helicase RecG